MVFSRRIFLLLAAAIATALPPSSAWVVPGRSGRRSKTIKLRGGYDQTIGVDPGVPLQLFVLPGHTCPYAQRTHIVLLELGIPHDLVEVTGMPKPDWYLQQINPRGKVPAIRVPTAGGKVVVESAICNEFLCDYQNGATGGEATTTTTLMPSDPFARAKIRLLNDHCDNVFAKTQFTFLMNKESDKDGELRTEMEEALVAFEEALSESGGPYLMGEEFTLADAHLFPFLQRLAITLDHWKDYQLPPEKFPGLIAWLQACGDREAVQKSSMTREQTIEVYTRFVEVDYGFGGLNQN